MNNIEIFMTQFYILGALMVIAAALILLVAIKSKSMK